MTKKNKIQVVGGVVKMRGDLRIVDPKNESSAIFGIPGGPRPAFEISNEFKKVSFIDNLFSLKKTPPTNLVVRGLRIVQRGKTLFVEPGKRGKK